MFPITAWALTLSISAVLATAGYLRIRHVVAIENAIVFEEWERV